MDISVKVIKIKSQKMSFSQSITSSNEHHPFSNFPSPTSYVPQEFQFCCCCCGCVFVFKVK